MFWFKRPGFSWSNIACWNVCIWCKICYYCQCSKITFGRVWEIGMSSNGNSREWKWVNEKSTGMGLGLLIRKFRKREWPRMGRERIDYIPFLCVSLCLMCSIFILCRLLQMTAAAAAAADDDDNDYKNSDCHVRNDRRFSCVSIDVGFVRIAGRLC